MVDFALPRSRQALLDLCRMVTGWDGSSTTYVAMLHFAHRVLVDEFERREVKRLDDLQQFEKARRSGTR